MTESARSNVREQLGDSVIAAVNLNRRLVEVIAVPNGRLGREGKRGKIDHSQPPWNAPVANLILDLHARAREMEVTLRAHLDMGPARRGGSDVNTRFALEAVSNLTEAIEDRLVAELVRWLDTWCSRALVVLGDRDLPGRLPRDVGQPEPRCPYCSRLTLRFWSSRGEVRCVNPACRDETNRRPAALMEYSIVSQDWVLAWRDGSVGVPTLSVDGRIAS